MGNNLDIFFPKLIGSHHEKTFRDMAIEFVASKGFEVYECSTDEEARTLCSELIPKRKWPCHFFDSDTSGEKGFEEFFTSSEEVVLDKFKGVGIVKLDKNIDIQRLNAFEEGLSEWRDSETWDQRGLIELLKIAVPEFEHVDKGKNLDQKM
jgi:hypothetical protein